MISALLLSACAVAPLEPNPFALEIPPGMSPEEQAHNTQLCNRVAQGVEAYAIACMQRRGYKLVRNPALQ